MYTDSLCLPWWDAPPRSPTRPLYLPRYPLWNHLQIEGSIHRQTIVDVGFTYPAGKVPIDEFAIRGNIIDEVRGHHFILLGQADCGTLPTAQANCAWHSWLCPKVSQASLIGIIEVVCTGTNEPIDESVSGSTVFGTDVRFATAVLFVFIIHSLVPFRSNKALIVTSNSAERAAWSRAGNSGYTRPNVDKLFHSLSIPMRSIIGSTTTILIYVSACDDEALRPLARQSLPPPSYGRSYGVECE